MPSFNKRRYWGAVGRPTYSGKRRRPRIHIGRCSHGTAHQIRIDAFGWYAYVVRRMRPWHESRKG